MQPRIIFSLLALALASCANQPTAMAPVVPESLGVAAHERVASVLARGVQIYECRAKKDNAAAAEWALVAPEAELFDEHSKMVGRHYAGPHWESLDGSKIRGTAKASVAAPQTGDIPWVLLAAQSVGPQGSFSRVTYVQRLDTHGGAAPTAAECTAASTGKQARVPYTANYVMLAPK
jgi:hypothetical protein